MFWLAHLRAHPEFRNGLREMVPQATGTTIWGLMTGVAMVKSGLSEIEALAMTFFVFAGSSQLAALPLLVAGAPAWVILATGFCVNLRFIVFSLHLRAYLMHLPPLRRAVAAYLTADLSYALHTHRFPQPPQDDAQRLAQEAYMAGHVCTIWVSWMVASILGIALAHVVPTTWGLDFAGILCLVGISCALASTRMRTLAAAVAGVTAVAAYALPLRLNIVVAIGMAVIVCMALEQRLQPSATPGSSS
ncbi:MAG: putative branched chain amino acid permease, azaleucine resistance [Pseudomonadota bacterium]|jgi:predicted branched-subunit amino acid permease